MNRRDKLITELLDELEDKERTIAYLRKKNREMEEKIANWHPVNAERLEGVTVDMTKNGINYVRSSVRTAIDNNDYPNVQGAE